MDQMKRIFLPIGIGLGLLALLGLTGSSLVLLREASAIHPALGIAVVVLLLVALWLLVVYPIGMVLALPRALIAPRRDDTARYRNYLRRYAARLARNDTLRASYTDMPALETALRSARDEASLDALSSQVTRALDHLDRIANQRIRQHAAAVFVATGVSQSGRLDAGIVLSAQLRLVNEIARLYYQQPTPRELWHVYANVGAAAFVAGEIQDSEILAVLGAPVSAALSGFVPLHGTGPLVSLLVQSLLDGSANALLTLRVGVLARRACAPLAIEDRNALSRSASLEAAGLLGGVVSDGAGRIASATRNLVVDTMAKSPETAMRGLSSGGTAVIEGIARATERATGSVVRASQRALDSAARLVGLGGEAEVRPSPETNPAPAPDSVPPGIDPAAGPRVDPTVIQDTARFWDHVAAFFAR
ncbi:MAG: DUF697 domain-containing protein [Candidatus Eisenbacteria bacterium]|nr:DUF697 domain-containing protein [Candidatus Eisenbacteria bacterium]